MLLISGANINEMRDRVVKLKRIRCYILCAVACLLVGCANTQTEIAVEGLYCSVENVPSINEFPGTRYEDDDLHFAEIESATYIYDGKELYIEPNDPRLIRLLNFLAYSDKKGLSSLQQGYLDEEQINDLRLSEFPQLEVRFDCAENEKQTSLSRTFKILVCGDSYLRYSNTCSTDYSVMVERYWPYGELVMSMVVEEKLPMNVLSYEGWGTGYWIDLLKYAGFP